MRSMRKLKIREVKLKELFLASLSSIGTISDESTNGKWHDITQVTDSSEEQ